MVVTKGDGQHDGTSFMLYALWMRPLVSRHRGSTDLMHSLITNNSSHFWIQPHSISQEDDTVKTKSHIEFKITNDMFQNGRLHLRCIAFISDVYRKSADMEIAVDEPLLASITGDAPAHSHSKS
ncbi:hypothetical protein HZH68_007446 [Vespula germanica]|uniref:Uncharacterized protein n=1 Tax=Vespula germanica TaxID=30212 RepID=A0A834KD05_VESGE|nr:hypothetical protein HZH68_007446 [Vespula germanica]